MGRHRRRNALAKKKPGRLPTLAMADARTHHAHLISDEAFDAGCRAGRYLAVCGTEVLAASLTTLERKYCEYCARWWAAR